ncbi:hypothetical protein TSUD_190540 [Trifolium subterraneum]|uniref:Uncharacterized protein n=1 Tax=Trifolium subterraneum TaxID=3900 RepID=A0A2Z6N8Q4_TRISU|nr:hypothetical protein TSUD_190540 [Trifolium subterraneum]
MKLLPKGNEISAIHNQGRKERYYGLFTGDIEFFKMEPSNVAGFAEGEHGVHEYCKLVIAKVRVRVVEVEDLEMFLEVAPSARNETHSRDGGSRWEKG